MHGRFRAQDINAKEFHAKKTTHANCKQAFISARFKTFALRGFYEALL